MALERQLAELLGMSPAQLRAKWRDCWRKPAPDIGPDLLRRGIAWKLQARVHGDLPSHVKRELERAAERLRRGDELTGSRPPLKSGTRLVRSWQGKVHHVLVVDDGYEYEGRRFSSLTQIATAITSERIRDKVAASKRKGMWMGGPVPLGYRIEGRKLCIDEMEAATVRHIYRRYAEVRSIGVLADELAAAGVRSKIRNFKTGGSSGGVAFTPGSISQLLKNPVFVGKVHHLGELFKGEHQAIIDVELWERVQSILKSNTRDRQLGIRVRSPSLLRGLISDPDGRPMTPTFTTKNGQQHRYYLTRLKPGEPRESAWRVPAGDIERAVLDCLVKSLTARMLISDQADWTAQAPQEQFLKGAVPEQRRMLLDHAIRVQLTSAHLIVTIGSECQDRVEMPARLLKKGNELKLVIDADGRAPVAPDPVLLKLMAHARRAQEALLSGLPDPLVSDYSKAHLARLLKLSWLAPDMIAAITEGRQPPTLTGRRLLRAADVPLDWQEQRRFFGFK